MNFDPKAIYVRDLESWKQHEEWNDLPDEFRGALTELISVFEDTNVRYRKIRYIRRKWTIQYGNYGLRSIIDRFLAGWVSS